MPCHIVPQHSHMFRSTGTRYCISAMPYRTIPWHSHMSRRTSAKLFSHTIPYHTIAFSHIQKFGIGVPHHTIEFSHPRRAGVRDLRSSPAWQWQTGEKKQTTSRPKLPALRDINISPSTNTIISLASAPILDGAHRNWLVCQLQHSCLLESVRFHGIYLGLAAGQEIQPVDPGPQPRAMVAHPLSQCCLYWPSYSIPFGMYINTDSLTDITVTLFSN